jgi:hypothetical protein
MVKMYKSYQLSLSETFTFRGLSYDVMTVYQATTKDLNQDKVIKIGQGKGTRYSLKM